MFVQATGALHDLDALLACLASGDRLAPDNAVNAWNLFSDVANSVGARRFKRLDRSLSKTYSRLFSTIRVETILEKRGAAIGATADVFPIRAA